MVLVVRSTALCAARCVSVGIIITIVSENNTSIIILSIPIIIIIVITVIVIVVTSVAIIALIVIGDEHWTVGASGAVVIHCKLNEGIEEG